MRCYQERVVMVRVMLVLLHSSIPPPSLLLFLSLFFLPSLSYPRPQKLSTSFQSLFNFISCSLHLLS